MPQLRLWLAEVMPSACYSIAWSAATLEGRERRLPSPWQTLPERYGHVPPRPIDVTGELGANEQNSQQAQEPDTAAGAG